MDVQPSVTLPVSCRECGAPVTLQLVERRRAPDGARAGVEQFWMCPCCGRPNRGVYRGLLTSVTKAHGADP